jgi:RNA polymerase sigma-70 factor (ECF subfamily)
MDPELLLDRCRQGDELAWEALVRQHQSRIYGLALSYVKDAEEARDLAQEIFVRLFRGLDSFRSGEAFLPWMVKVARNACVDHLRRRRVRPRRALLPEGEEIDVPDPRPGPDEVSAGAATRRLLHRALRELGEMSREMIILKEIQGLDLEEVASVLGIPVGTVKSRSHRARLELARALIAIEPAYGARAEG